jgi:hypothetical protein
MATFRLLPGGPAKIDGRVLRPGDTVRHDANLAQLFKNRFELVSGTPGVPAEDGGDEPVPLQSGLTPHDVATTRRSTPGARFAPTEPPEPSAQDQAPVTRPANAPRGGTSLEGGGEVADEEMTDGTEQQEESEDVEETPARTSRRAAPKAASHKTTTHKRR